MENMDMLLSVSRYRGICAALEMFLTSWLSLTLTFLSDIGTGYIVVIFISYHWRYIFLSSVSRNKKQRISLIVLQPLVELIPDTRNLIEQESNSGSTVLSMSMNKRRNTTICNKLCIMVRLGHFHYPERKKAVHAVLKQHAVFGHTIHLYM